MATRKATARGARGKATLREYRAKRDFTRTKEPEGAAGRNVPRSRGVRRLQFVIQKHAATHLHYDLRLELDGVMKSWAVPKGPSLDPTQRRLAVQVEDHPMEYNTFEGTIPAGEYGGGTVMLWDRGTYEPDDGSVDSLRRGYERGDLKVTFHGVRLRGSFALVRMASRGEGKPQWLLIKHRDSDAVPRWDINEVDTSVTTGRTMDEIRDGKSKVWHSNRAGMGDGGSGKRGSGAAERSSHIPHPTSHIPHNPHDGLHRHQHPDRGWMDLRTQVRRRARAGIRFGIQR